MEITKGEWYNNSLEKKIRDGNQGIICELIAGIKTDQELEANAQLIAEAGTVKNETGFSPRQLAEQKDVAVKMLNKILNINNTAFGLKGFDIIRLKSDIKKALKSTKI